MKQTGIRFDGGPVLELETALSPEDVYCIRIWAKAVGIVAVEEASQKIAKLRGFGSPDFVEGFDYAIRVVRDKLANLGPNLGTDVPPGQTRHLKVTYKSGR